nr:ribonuclease H-like domain-containing protein [Tanacetum cinerariifolium]
MIYDLTYIRGNGGNQFRQYAGQNAGNSAGYNDVIGNQNQIGNGNLVAARAEGNAAGQNGNQIRCYNCSGVGHYARNCTFRPRRRDAAYLQTQLLIAQKEEAGIQLQAEDYDLMAAAADLDEIEKVNANCILMANMQQASTLGTQTDSAPVYDTDGSAEVIQICLWCIDSGCSKHMTGNLKLLINFVLKFMGTVRFGNDHVAAIMGFSDLQWGNILITRVYFVKGLGHNLFSVGKSKRMPPIYWVEALHMVAHLLNIPPLTAIQNTIPHIKLYNTKPTYDNHRVFGCLSYLYIQDVFPFGSMTLTSPSSYELLLHNLLPPLRASQPNLPTHTTEPTSPTPLPTTPISPTGRIPIPTNPTIPLNTLLETQAYSPPNTQLHFAHQYASLTATAQQQPHQPHTSPPNSPQQLQPTHEHQPITKPFMVHRQPAPIPSNIHPVVTRAKDDISKHVGRLSLYTTTTSSIPRSHIHALRDPVWQKAMLDEYNALITNGTKIDSSLFIFHRGTDIAYMLLYVDDIIGNLLSWSAKRQATLSRSSVEAEYRGESIFKRFCKYLIGESSETNAESLSHAAYPSETGAKAEVGDQVAEMLKGGSILKFPSNDLGESSEFFYLEISQEEKGEQVTEFSPATFVAGEDDMSPGNMCHGGTNYLTEKYVGPTVSLGIVTEERIPSERFPTNIPQRQVARERYPSDKSLGKASKCR